jgi:hypothetical protein
MAFYDAMPLAWPRWQFTPRDIPRGVDCYVDVLRISKETEGWNISIERPYGSHDKIPRHKGIYRFQLMATADDAEPFVHELDINYEQDWNTLRVIPKN